MMVEVQMKVKKNNGSNLVAVKFGSWLVSSPIPRVSSESGFTKSCLLTAHVLYLQNFSESEAQLSEEIKKF